MDALDFELLAGLHRDGLASHAALGRAVGLSATSVGERLAKLQRAGVLEGFWLAAEPGVFRRRNLLLHFAGRWAERHARAALDAPDVVWVALKHDGSLTVQAYPGEDATTALARLRELLGAAPARTMVASGPDRWPVLSPLDWRLVEAMARQPRSAVAALAVSTGLSPKTVRARRGRLVEQGWLRVLPHLGPLRGGGVVVFHLGVFGPRLPSDRDFRRAWPPSVVVHRLDEPPGAYLFGRAEDLAGALAAQARLRALPGVEEVQLTLNRSFLVNAPRLAGWAAAERAAWERARRAPAGVRA